MMEESLDGEHTVAEMRSLRQIATKGENAQLSTLKSVRNS